MSSWLFLGCAICCEVAATLCLSAASRGRQMWWLAVGAGYICAFVFLSWSLAAGMQLSIAYGLWAAIGVALTAVLSAWIFREPLSWLMAGGIALVIGGVLLIETGR